MELGYIIDHYRLWKKEEPFFTKYFNTLAGTDELRKQIESGMSVEEIKNSWQLDLNNYKTLRIKYLLYQD
jgi:uncharacterized protein YbbC (DUF1343 family)